MDREAAVRTVTGALIAGLVGLLSVGPLAAQDGAPRTDWRPGFGDRSLAFSLPAGGGSTLALWWHRSRQGAIGLEVGVHGNVSLSVGGSAPDRFGSSVAVSVGPAFKRYRGSLGPVAPYSITGFGLVGTMNHQTIDDAAVEPVTAWLAGAYFRVGGGVDWFVAERVSVGGHVGGRVDYHIRFPRDAAEALRHELGLGTFTGGLTLHIYF
jgi:hypothetical protein